MTDTPTSDKHLQAASTDTFTRPDRPEADEPKDTPMSYQARLTAWEKARFAPPPDAPAHPIEPTLTVMMPMRDGVRLYTEIFLPPENALKDSGHTETIPVILTRSPYPFARTSRHGGLTVPRYLAEGYAIASQQTRGQGQSEGHYRFLVDDIQDGYDTVQWLAEQTWCNGNIGMIGPSYMGSTQLMAARAKPPALKCIMPTAFIGHFTRCYPFSCGVPAKGLNMFWHRLLDAESMETLEIASANELALQHPTWGPALRHRPLIDAANDILPASKLSAWREAMANPTDNAHWAPLHFSDEQLAALDIPIFFTDGWYDMTIGPIDYFSRLEKLQPEKADRYLLVGPWNHVQTAANSKPGENDGERTLPRDGEMDHIKCRLAFFDRYLKDDHQVKVQPNRVRVYISGAPNSNANIWKDLPTFPAPQTQYQHFYLHSQGNAYAFPGDGLLDQQKPGEEPADHYTYDPELPTHFRVNTADDRRDVEIRADVLTYTSEPLTSPLTILGDMTLVLHAASDAPDTDWFTVLTEVFPDGQSKSFYMAPPAFRARYRHGLDKEVLLTPNQPEEYRIPLGPAGHQLAVGHRLRLSIFSAAFPQFDPNTNTGNPAATDTAVTIANQTIFHNRARPSHLILPIVDFL